MQEQLDRIEMKLAEVAGKAAEAAAGVEKIRKYMFWTAVITAAVIVIPLLLFPLVLPSFLNSVALPSGY